MPLVTKKPVGNGITAPVYKKGTTVIIPETSKSIPTSSPLPDMSSGPNLSAKYKNGRQEVPEAGRNQYE